MKEIDIINVIKSVINTDFIGDDCAYLKDLGIVITQDSLVENIHFKREWYTPRQLGYKSIIVNASDILASGAKPAYYTVALSLPPNISTEYVKDFYIGINEAIGASKIIGGDITGSKNDIIISITAIGVAGERNISSRKNAMPGYKIITSGMYGASCAGLKELLQNNYNGCHVQAHIKPVLNYKFSEQVSKCNAPYAMMDTSDGIMDALFKIAESSNVNISVDYEKIPKLKDICEKDVLFGGEDYNLIAAIPDNFVSRVEDAVVIGDVYEYKNVRLNLNERKYYNYDELSVYNHFGG